MYSKLFKLAIAIITILTVNLVTTCISDYIISTYKLHYKPLKFTLLGMILIVVIFYPLFLRMEKWLNVLSVKVVRTGKSFAGKYFGLLLSFLACFSILFYFYAKLWYKLDIIKLLFSGNLTRNF